MTVTVEFSSKDPVLAEYYRKRFGEAFTKTAQYWPQLTEMEREGMKAAWKLEMFHEARLQEHYDYTEDDKGRSTPIMEVWSGPDWPHPIPTDVPKLLIPQITVKELPDAE